MNEQAFDAEIDQLFFTLEQDLEERDPTVDCGTEQGILTITLQRGEQIILSRQATRQELWLACPQGAYHFQAQIAPTGITWVTRKGEHLEEIIALVFQLANIEKKENKNKGEK